MDEGCLFMIIYHIDKKVATALVAAAFFVSNHPSGCWPFELDGALVILVNNVSVHRGQVNWRNRRNPRRAIPVQPLGSSFRAFGCHLEAFAFVTTAPAQRAQMP